ncbi:MAG: SCP2 sterol-binding domain-containing protein [Firmicutes bacterium]|nr:SCP2 sterol-binding domain-containing protein [Bacillota bacterium]
MTVEHVIDDLINNLEEIPPELADMSAIYELRISGHQAVTYQLKIENQELEWVKGTPFMPTCIFLLADTDFLTMVAGELNPKLAIMKGQIKIQGDYGQALELNAILKKYY